MEKKPVSEGSGDSFEDRAARVSAAERTPETAPGVAEEPEQKKFIVDDGVAVWTVQKVFWPLQVYDHPAWEITDEEASLVSPKLQPFLQRFFDKWIPQWISQYASENKELAELVIAFGALYVIKRTQVKRHKAVDALIAEAKKKEEAEKNPPIDISTAAAPPANPSYEFVRPPVPKDEETPPA